MWEELEKEGIKPYYKDESVFLINADNKDILPLLPKAYCQLVLTDPPYQYSGTGGGFFGNWLENYDSKHKPSVYINELQDADCLNFSPASFLTALKRPLKKFYGYFFCNKELVDVYIKYARLHKLMFDILVMAKNNPLPASNSHHLRDLEYCIMLRAKGTKYYHSTNFDDNRKFYLVNTGGVSYHPAEKPIGFLMRMIQVSSELGSIILDPFAGSGSTLLAAKELGRKSIGIEYSEKYAEITAMRLSQTKMHIASILMPEVKQLELV